MPTMLSTIVAELIRGEPDMVVVGCSEPGQDGLRAAHDVAADIIITQDVPGKGKTCLEAILRGPPLGIFALAPDGRTAAAVNLVRYPVPVDVERQPVLAASIRGMADMLSRNADEGDVVTGTKGINDGA
jgi:chemotaxis response regulator CheB